MTTISVAKQFSRFPAGRYRTDGDFSGELFRDKLLVPALKSGDQVVVELDGVAGYGSSFLEEAFGGAVRALHLTVDRAMQQIQPVSTDPSLIDEVAQYIREAAQDAGAKLR